MKRTQTDQIRTTRLLLHMEENMFVWFQQMSHRQDSNGLLKNDDSRIIFNYFCQKYFDDC